MSNQEIGNIPQIARELVDHLPKAMDEELRHLIDRAERGQDTTIEIIDLFSQHEATRRWLRDQIDSQSREKGIGSGSSPLAGNSNLVPASQKWVCRKNIRDHWRIVIQEGEDAPICTVHNIEMVRENK